jgi:hypothetical protein
MQFPKGFIRALHQKSTKTFLRRLCKLEGHRDRLSNRRKIIKKASSRQRKLLLDLLRHVALGDIVLHEQHIKSTKRALAHVFSHFHDAETYRQLKEGSDEEQIDVLAAVTHYGLILHFLWNL